MGNRAVITTKENFNNNGVGIYVHWAGSRESVQAFLDFCDLRGYRYPEDDPYGWSYLTTTIANYFGSGISVGIDTVNNLDCDNWDNGVYLIHRWQIVGREYAKEESEFNIERYARMLIDINKYQPERMQLDSDSIIQRIEERRSWKIDR